MAEINGYTLSRDWFNFCFENPEKISPNHTALYFFAIEHCNRLGWKSKFGLPMEMAKEAIGIKNYRTYSKTFNDLVDWGFLKLIQKSKNQYSSNIVAIVKNTKADTKALDKAMQKHDQKQVHGIVGINKPINNKLNNYNTWRENFEIYQKDLLESIKSFDKKFFSDVGKSYPDIDVEATMKKAFREYWNTEDGWKKKKQGKGKTIDWRTTFRKACGMEFNQVKKQVELFDVDAYRKSLGMSS